MSDRDDMALLRRILKAFDHFINTREVTDELTSVFYEINELSFDRSIKEKRIYKFSEFMRLYSVNPLKDLIPFDTTKSEEIKSYRDSTIITEKGEINEDLIHYLTDYSSEEDVYQKEWVPILNYLRREDQRDLQERQNDYDRIRIGLMTKQPFIQSTKFLKEVTKNFAHSPRLMSFIEDAYTDYLGDTAILCPRCKYPMEKLPFERYQCVGHFMCQHYNEYSSPNLIVNTRNTEYKILKKGFYIFTTLPSMFELQVEKMLNKKGYQTKRHPNLEANGDIEVLLPDRSVYLDCKTHQNAFKLMKKLEGDPKSIDMNYFVIPSFLYKNEYKNRLDNLNMEKGIKNKRIKKKGKYRFATEKCISRLLEVKKYEQIELFGYTEK
ncbi:hypothetical protein [Thermoactinomyces sp. DSM 45892]|uniref:restriction endonuclease-related protein n=1 Tax=Thermoactinomyces sp. DSM 45892 TaxID=1882753 RepID=UPI00089925CE|nr:hypothetical protein [Thermoactinomyces sp. DSM 45892]SDX93078.1 hypothetical protein SAMN05444416_10136 [Thermoactinomyces sp. DSM 45892]